MNEELKVKISAEVDKFKKNIAIAKKSVEDFTKGSEKGASKMDEQFKKAGESIKKGLGTAVKGAIGTITALGVAMVGTVSSTEEYREAQAKLNTAFESVGASADIAKNVYNDLYRVLGDSDVAVEASNHLAKITTSQKDLSEYTKICQGVYATFGDSLPIEGLTEAINHTSKLGETQGVLADALEWSGVSTDEFNSKLAKCSTEAEREKLIRETLNGLYNEASENYEKNNKGLLKQRDAQAQLQENLAKVGEALQPVVTLFTELGSKALEKVTPYIQSFAENYLPIIREILIEVADKLQVAFEFVSQYYPILVGIATAIGIIAVAIGVYNTASAIKTAMDVAQVTTVGALVSAYLAQAAAMAVALAPYVLIVAAITAVIAIIVLCIKHWDTIKAKVIEVTKGMVDKVKDMAEKVKSWFTKLKENISKALTIIINFVKSNWQGLLLLIVNPFAGAFKLAYDNCEGFRSKVDGFISKVKSLLKQGFETVKSNIVNPIKNAFSSVKTVFGNIVTAIAEKLNSAKTKVKSAIDKIRGFFNFKWSLPKLKMPKISISGKFSINPPSVPKFKISWHKLGGIFDKPTLFNYGGNLHGLGEDGAEAIVPLEKNTQWLDKIAEKLNAKQGNTPVVLNVDGKTFAQTSIRCINDLTKQTGKLPLVLA